MSGKQGNQGIQPPTKRKPGRPAVWVNDIVELTRRACRLGATNKALAGFFDVSEGTINDWIRDKPEFAEAIRDGRTFADAHVADSLYRKATGYEHQAVKIFCNAEGDITEVPYTERYAPDTTAAIFWLKNRRPDLWRDVKEKNENGEGSGNTYNIVMNMPGVASPKLDGPSDAKPIGAKVISIGQNNND